MFATLRQIYRLSVIATRTARSPNKHKVIEMYYILMITLLTVKLYFLYQKFYS